MAKILNLLGRMSGLTALLLAPLCAETSASLDAVRVRWAAQWLDRFAEEGMRRTGVPGLAVAVVYRDEVVYLRGFGVREAGQGALVTPDTIFPLAELSESVTATGVAAIVGQGYAQWDAPVHLLDPDFKFSDDYLTREVSVRDLFSHRSGLPRQAGELLQDLGYSQGQILNRLRYLPTSDLRAQFAETAYGITEAVLAVSHHYGDAWENILQTELLQPLGMKSTSSLANDAAAPARGVTSTARDLAEWMRLLLAGGSYAGKELITPSQIAQLYRPAIVTSYDNDANRPAFYGLGWNVEYTAEGMLRVWKSGASSRGASTHATLYPGDNLGIVVLTNAAQTGLAEAMADMFFDLVHNGFSVSGALSQDWIAVDTALARQKQEAAAAAIRDYSQLPTPRPVIPATFPLSVYTGSYHNYYYGDVEIQLSADGNGLVMIAGPNRFSYPLAHFNRDTFTYFFDGASQPPGRRAMIFRPASGGTVDQVTIDNFSTEAPGTFLRIFTTIAEANGEHRGAATNDSSGVGNK